MKRLLYVAALGVAIFALGCNFDDIDISNITGDGDNTEVANADSTSTPTDGSSADGSSTDETAADGEPGDSPSGETDATATTDGEDTIPGETLVPEGETVLPEGETGSGDRSESPPVDLDKLGKLERDIASAFVGAGAKIKIENGHVTELSWEHAQLNPQITKQLYQLTALNALDLQYSNMSDELMVGVELLRHLQYINLDGTQIGDPAMGRLILKGTPTYIDADSTQVTGNTLDGLIKSRKQVTVCLARLPLLPDATLQEAARVGKNRFGLVSDSATFGKVGPRRETVAGVKQTN